MKLAGKVALVTGGSGGLGRAIVELLAREQAQVVSTFLHGEAPQGPHVRAVCLDVSKSGDVTRLFETIAADYGRLDILVNNAGVNRDAKLADLTEAMFDEVLATNLKGPFLCSKAAAPLMSRHGGGAIVNIASESALRGRVGAANYTAAKAGLVALTKSLARELAPSIRVNCLAPGLVRTQEVVARFGLDEEPKLRKAIEEIPLRRLGMPEEVAQAVLFFVSDDSSYVTGQVLAVGGGRWM